MNYNSTVSTVRRASYAGREKGSRGKIRDLHVRGLVPEFASSSRRRVFEQSRIGLRGVDAK